MLECKDDQLDIRVIRREQVKPGDVLLLTVPANASAAERKCAVQFLSRIADSLGAMAVVMPSDYSLTVVGSEFTHAEAQHVMSDAQRTEAEGILAEFKGCHERVVSVIPVDPFGAKIVTETGKEFEVSGALAVPLRRPRNQQGGATSDHQSRDV